MLIKAKQRERQPADALINHAIGYALIVRCLENVVLETEIRVIDRNRLTCACDLCLLIYPPRRMCTQTARKNIRDVTAVACES